MSKLLGYAQEIAAHNGTNRRENPNLIAVPDFKCSKCGQPKPRTAFHESNASDRSREVTSQCRECRSQTYFDRRYPKTICAQCLRHRPLDENRICRSCNEETGLRQCTACGHLLALYLEYYSGRRICRTCSKQRRGRKPDLTELS
jgi:hypothetical protein